MPAHESKTQVMFQHCDPAGIVFYPRYFEMVNALVEGWFDRELGWSFAQMHGRDGLGVPTGRISAEFSAPARLGEWLDWTLAVTRVGTSSAELRIRARGAEDGAPKLEAGVTLVCVSLSEMKSRAWPEAIRAKFAQYQE